MITLTELQTKEVVMVHNGKRLGQIMDLEIDDETGFITNIIILEQGKGALFQKPDEIKIRWGQIKTIGTDIILVDEEGWIQKESIEEESRQNE